MRCPSRSNDLKRTGGCGATNPTEPFHPAPANTVPGGVTPKVVKRVAGVTATSSTSGNGATGEWKFATGDVAHLLVECLGCRV